MVQSGIDWAGSCAGTYRIAANKSQDPGIPFRENEPRSANFSLHWLEYNGTAADVADQRLHRFLDRHLK